MKQTRINRLIDCYCLPDTTTISMTTIEQMSGFYHVKYHFCYSGGVESTFIYENEVSHAEFITLRGLTFNAITQYINEFIVECDENSITFHLGV